MHIYECPYDRTDVETPELDVWEALLGNTTRGIPDDKPMIIDANTGTNISYGEARSLALKFANGLRTTGGLTAGDVVCIFSPSSLLYPIICMAVQAAGLIASLANPTYTQKEFLHQLRDSRVDLILASSDMLDTARDASKEAGIHNDRVYALPGADGKLKSGALSYERLVSDKQWTHEDIRGADLDGVACGQLEFSWSSTHSLSRKPDLPYSSGTTGLPKGVVVSHRNVVAMSEMLIRLPHFFTQDTVVMGVLPMFHMFSLTLCVRPPCVSLRDLPR